MSAESPIDTSLICIRPGAEGDGGSRRDHQYDGHRPPCFDVFLIQNHPVMVLGTTAFLNQQPDLTVKGVALTPDESLKKLATSQPDIVVLEVSVNGPYDFAFLKNLRTAYPGLPILVYSYHEEVIFARRSINSGANGYLMKEAPPEKLVEAIRVTLAGETYVSERVKTRIKLERQFPGGKAPKHLNGTLVNSLTNRELQIFQLLGDGNSLFSIQEKLEIPRSTLTDACCRMRKKLGLKGTTELVQFARHWAYYEGDFS